MVQPAGATIPAFSMGAQPARMAGQILLQALNPLAAPCYQRPVFLWCAGRGPRPQPRSRIGRRVRHLRTHRPTASDVHFDPSGAPTEHTTETKISLSAQETLGLPVTTRNVAEAVGPGSPFSPFGPGIPGGPGSPFSPLGPAIPVGPGSPFSPLGPCPPSGPCGPLQPAKATAMPNRMGTIQRDISAPSKSKANLRRLAPRSQAWAPHQPRQPAITSSPAKTAGPSALDVLAAIH